jgi:hypothetical protein
LYRYETEIKLHTSQFWPVFTMATFVLLFIGAGINSVGLYKLNAVDPKHPVSTIENHQVRNWFQSLLFQTGQLVPLQLGVHQPVQPLPRHRPRAVPLAARWERSCEGGGQITRWGCVYKLNSIDP